jgi:hypothetical protein
MTIEGTYNDLLSVDQDIQRWIPSSPSYYLFNQQKIKTFYSQNVMRLNIAKEKLQKLADAHVQIDAEGKLMKIEEEGVFKSWVFFDEEHENAYKEAYALFIGTTFKIHC